MKLNSTNYGIYKPMRWLVMLITLVFISGVSYSQVAINNDNSAPAASANAWQLTQLFTVASGSGSIAIASRATSQSGWM